MFSPHNFYSACPMTCVSSSIFAKVNFAQFNCLLNQSMWWCQTLLLHLPLVKTMVKFGVTIKESEKIFRLNVCNYCAYTMYFSFYPFLAFMLPQKNRTTSI